MLCDKKVPLKFKCKFYRVTVRPAMLYEAELLASQELPHSKNEGRRNENVALDVWTYQRG